PLPEIPYVAMHLWEKKSSLIPSIVMLVQECCDFSRIFGIDVPIKGKGWVQSWQTEVQVQRLRAADHPDRR
ncbi:MAG: hypothetical protein LBE85_01585, partial [Candidatus Accumulibacter sp.]|nr:hypothetical protein [Accumulibacter sp.]